MSPDDAADLVADLDQDTRDEILAHMEQDEAEEVQELLGYPEDSAGGIMTTEYIALERAPDRRPRRSTGCASSSPTPRRSTTSTSPTTTAGSSACSRCAT